MGQFLYFIGDGPVDFLEALNAAGLAERVAASPNRTRMIGPGGKEGYGVTYGSEQIAYHPERQVWTGPYLQAGLHIGYWRDRPPGPADLIRREALDGHDVVLADGNAWRVPCWRLSPQTVTMTPTRELVYDPLPPRRILERHMRRMLELFREARPDGEEAPGGEVTALMDDAEMLTVSAEVLAVNYRIAPDPTQEVSILKLITGTAFMHLMEAVLDLPFLAELAQKKTAG